METKKTNLENKRGLFLEIGLVLTLALVFLAFEWRTDLYEVDHINSDVQELFVEDVPVPITREQVKLPPAPPSPKVSDILQIIDNEDDFEEVLDIEEPKAHVDDTFGDQVMDGGDPDGDEHQIFVIVEEMPEFYGGEAALLRWLAKTVVYPTIAIENRISGRVHLKFVVNETGGIEDITVVKGVDPCLDQEAIRVVKQMPKWKPGKQRGKAVKVSYSLPISFQLR